MLFTKIMLFRNSVESHFSYIFSYQYLTSLHRYIEYGYFSIFHIKYCLFHVIKVHDSWQMIDGSKWSANVSSRFLLTFFFQTEEVSKEILSVCCCSIFWHPKPTIARYNWRDSLSLGRNQKNKGKNLPASLKWSTSF